MRHFITTLTISTAFLAVQPRAICQQPDKPADKPRQPEARPAPKTAEKKERKGTKWDAMEVGPFFSSGLGGKNPTLKALAIKLGQTNEAAVCFDTELLRMSLGWTDGFLRLATGRDGLEGVPEVGGKIAFSVPTGPGWAKDGSFTDPRPAAPEDPKGKPCGPLPRDWGHWRGLYLHGNQTVLSYSVGQAGVLEVPGLENRNGLKIFTRTFQVEPGNDSLSLFVAEESGAAGNVEGNVATLEKENKADGSITCTAAAFTGNVKAEWIPSTAGRLQLKLPKLTGPASFRVAIWSGPKADLAKFAAAATKSSVTLPDLRMFCKGGPSHWGEPIVTQGVLGKESGPYAVDTITVPEKNPFNSWIRCGGFDFFSDASRAAICSVSGDVWIVSGIDDKLEKLQWKRFATGLFQPLGLKIVNDKVYVTGRDQITRLHDLNGDGEADYYENFNNDVSITAHYHEFCLGLETDSKGNFYFNKGGNLDKARIPHHGTLLKVSKDGSKLEVVAYGLRAPNGLGMGPNDEITTADNEGNWVPSSRVDLVKPGAFLGHVHTAHAATPPKDYDKPIFWLPHNYEFDNSSGGQVWVTSDKWGAFQGDMLHTSYGASSLFKVMMEKVDGQVQGGAVKLPLKFNTGIMRGRFNPRDGQLYLCGLNVWQSNGPKQGGFQRVRYTGKPVHMPAGLHVRKNGLLITFTNPLDPASAGDAQNYSVEQWNYKWTSNYGSPEFSVVEPDKKGHDKVAVKSARLMPDKKTVFLEIADLKPVMQMKVKFKINAADGTPINSEIHNTINRVPATEVAAN